MKEELEKYVVIVSEFTTGTDGCEVINLDAKYALLGNSSTICVCKGMHFNPFVYLDTKPVYVGFGYKYLRFIHTK